MLYDYGGRMLELLNEKGLTEEFLSKETRIQPGEIHAFLHYNMPIDFVYFEKMLKAIDVSVVEFFSFNKKPKNKKNAV